MLISCAAYNILINEWKQSELYNQMLIRNLVRNFKWDKKKETKELWMDNWKKWVIEQIFRAVVKVRERKRKIYDRNDNCI